MNPEIFASYCNLRSQVLRDLYPDRLTKQDRMNRLKEFAACNPSVTDLQYYGYHDNLKFHYRIGRDVDGRITTMVEVLENGLCYSDSFASHVLTVPHREGCYLALSKLPHAIINL